MKKAKLQKAAVLSEKVVFPAILISATLNQQFAHSILQFFGQVLGWVALGGAVLICFKQFGDKKWPIILAAMLLASKAGRIAMGDYHLFYVLYTISMAGFFCAAGATIACKSTMLIYKQVMFFCMASIPLMLLQVVGMGEWTQYFRTDMHGFLLTKEQVPTLFMEGGQLIVTTLQGRPAGFCFANNYLSIVLMFALSLHYGLDQDNRITAEDLSLSAIAILCMSKIVFLTFAILFLKGLFTEALKRKFKWLKVATGVAVFAFIYYIFFPGLFEYNLSIKNAHENFTIRVMDINEALGGNRLLEDVICRFGTEEPIPIFALEKGAQSGYRGITKVLPVLAGPLLFGMIMYLRKIRRMRFVDSSLTKLSVNGSLILILMPMVTSFIEGALFWFIAGFGVFPLLVPRSRISKSPVTSRQGISMHSLQESRDPF